MSSKEGYGLRKTPKLRKELVKQRTLVGEDISTLEVNTMIEWRGDLYVTLGPLGEIWRYDGEVWHRIYQYPTPVKEAGRDQGWRATWWAREAFTVDDHLYFGGFAPHKVAGEKGIFVEWDGDTATLHEPELSDEIFSMAESDGYLYAGTLHGKILRSADGSTWTHYDTVPAAVEGWKITSMMEFTGDGLLYLGVERRVYSYDPATKTFTKQVDLVSPQAMVQSYNRHFNEDWLIVLGGKGNLAFYDGSTWTVVRAARGVVRNRKVLTLYTPTAEYASEPLLYFVTGRRGKENRLASWSRLWVTDLDELRCLAEVPYSISHICEYGGQLVLGTAHHPAGKPWKKEQGEHAPYIFTRLSTVQRVQPTTLGLGRPLPMKHLLWEDASIDAGEATDAVLIGGYDKKTIYFETDSAGDLSIQISLDYGKNWKTYDTVSISADTLKNYIMTGDAPWMRLKFDTAATVSAWVNTR